MHTDHIVRAIVEDANLRAIAVVATDTAREASERHGAAATSAVLLSEALTGGLLLARLHKAPRRVNLQMEVEGPIRGLVVDADAEGAVRGFARRADLDLGVDEVALARAMGGRGMVNVLREMTPSEWYRGTVALPRRSIARGLESYLSTSEQVESVVELVTVVDDAGRPRAAVGVLFQRLPDGMRAALEAVRIRLEEGWLERYVRRALESGEEVTAGVLLDALLEAKGGDNLQIFDRSDVRFHCGCTRDRVESALLLVGADGLREMRQEDGRAEVTCDFCRERYEVDADRLEELAAVADSRR